MPAVRRATLADSAAAWTLVDEYCRDFGIVIPDDEVSFRGYLAGSGALWLADERDDVMGCVGLRPLPNVGPDAGEVKRLYVRPSHRRKGIAGALMDALETAARESGYRALYLDTKDDMPTAIRFYESRGYERIPRYNDNPQATIFMRRLL
jgi:ribosomal protein S18 acetylase RimI-like enzyme